MDAVHIGLAAGARRRRCAELALAGAALVALAAAASAGAGSALGLGDGFVVRALVFSACGAGLALTLAARHLPADHLGAANAVTLVRLAIVAVVAALAGIRGDAAAWLAVALAAGALALDGVDGWLARRHGTASAFGARLDMETDAALILALCVLAWLGGKAGAWVLCCGLMRYGFIAAGLVLPALRRPLPPSRRRQTVCVVQGAALLACLAPPVVAPASMLIAAAGLAALTWSFALDVHWLATRPAEQVQ